ncbi:MAG: bifunctional diaminohydroxyphosphoribosylaminopyrimidine deaminase/5-amino-6-(5-phosphoribosylamino)uracil reductase RibD [Pseudomonadota bacterium]
MAARPETGEAAEDLRWMAAALTLARRGRGSVAPNPAVAALIVRGGQLLARGVTAPGGRPHAEAEALARLAARGLSAAGATVYVTLEPCAHHGQTPPCVDALIAAGVARVVCPMVDPDPRVSGRGFARLRAAGVAVSVGPCADEAAAVNDGFLSCVTRRRPALTLKLATTLDGRIATAAGESRWITGPAARRMVHVMRAEADAVLIGAGTARTDDPMLDVRGLGDAVAQPRRVVADPAFSLPHGSRLARTAAEQAVWLLHRPFDAADAGEGAAIAARGAALSAKGVRLLEIAPVARVPQAALAQHAAPAKAPLAVPPPGHGHVLDPQVSALPSALPAPDAMLARLALEGVNSVLCEGGGRLAAALLSAGLVDRLVTFTAGAAIGAEGIAALGQLGLTTLAGAPRFTLQSLDTLEGDVMACWTPQAGAPV